MSRDDELQFRVLWVGSRVGTAWFIHRCKNQLFHAVPYCFKRAKQRAPNHCLKCPLLSSFCAWQKDYDECHTCAIPLVPRIQAIGGSKFYAIPIRTYPANLHKIAIGHGDILSSWPVARVAFARDRSLTSVRAAQTWLRNSRSGVKSSDSLIKGSGSKMSVTTCICHGVSTWKTMLERAELPWSWPHRLDVVWGMSQLVTGRFFQLRWLFQHLSGDLSWCRPKTSSGALIHTNPFGFVWKQATPKCSG